MKFRIDVLICPACMAKNLSNHLDLHSTHLHCSVCGARYPVMNGVPNLLTDVSLRTKLEDINYDQVHSINEASRNRTFENWAKLLSTLAINSDKVLEIGSGTGQLTWGLMHRSNFNEVYATDVSGAFLGGIASRYAFEAKNQTYYYICDANQLPFQRESFDVVLGHSVLHHFLNYQDTLRAVSEILRPGGYAIFYEPIIQGKIFVAFFLKLIQMLDQSFQIDDLTEAEHKTIARMVKHITKASVIKGDKNVLKNMEDKYIFDLKEIEIQSTQLGFTSFEFRNFGKLDVSYKNYVANQWRMMGIDVVKLSPYEDLFDAFGTTVGSLISDTITTPMGYLIFRR